MSIFHIKQSEVGNRFAGVFSGFVAKINAHGVFAAAHFRSAFVKVGVAEDEAFLLASLFCLFFASAVEHLNFAEIGFGKLFILFCFSNCNSPWLRAEKQTNYH